MKHGALIFFLGVLPVLVASNDIDSIPEDPIIYDQDLEVVHLFNGQWPTGIAVSSSGRKFACFSAALDELNTNNGSNNALAVVELTGNDIETAYPNDAYNNPSGGAIDTSGPFPVTKGLSTNWLSVHSVYIDFLDYLWVVDTGRVLYNNVLLAPTTDGIKIVKIDLNTNSVVRTYILTPNVASGVSLILDIAVDTNNGYAFVSDGSPDQDNGIIVINTETGETHRVLDNDKTVTAIEGYTPFVWGAPLYQFLISPAGELVAPIHPAFGVDGLALSPDLATLYFSAFGGRYLYSVPTDLLRNRSTPASEIVAAVQNLGENGVSLGLRVDSNGKVYGGQAENNGVSVYDPVTTFVVLFIHDPRINTVDRLSVATDGYLYFIVNQLNYLKLVYNGQGEYGVDRREPPYVCFRKKLLDGATKAAGS